jgi:hypothetical protein
MPIVKSVTFYFWFLLALWITHYTLDGQRRQVVLFENESCSQLTGEICVLYTQQVRESADYILTGKVKLSIDHWLSGPCQPGGGRSTFFRKQKFPKSFAKHLFPEISKIFSEEMLHF